MARLAKFSLEQIVETTTRLAARDGPAQATMARIASDLQAPTGSIYHRFGSRDVLLGEVWLRGQPVSRHAHRARGAGGLHCLRGAAQARLLEMCLKTFATHDIPHGAVRRHLVAGKDFPRLLRSSLGAAVCAVIPIKRQE